MSGASTKMWLLCSVPFASAFAHALKVHCFAEGAMTLGLAEFGGCISEVAQDLAQSWWSLGGVLSHSLLCCLTGVCGAFIFSRVLKSPYATNRLELFGVRVAWLHSFLYGQQLTVKAVGGEQEADEV